MYEPKIIAFLCTWCSYTGADLAGTSRMQSPWNLRTLRVPCSGRVSPELVMRAFDQGADGVIVLGCHIGECHYDNGNHRTAKRIPILHNLMTFAGLEPERLCLDWVSASEGDRFAKIVTQFTDNLRELGPIKWTIPENERHISPEDRAIDGQLKEIGQTWARESEQSLELKTKEIRNRAKTLLTSNQVDCVIGYEVGPRGRTRPVFVYDLEDTDRLVWNQVCTHNLTTYLGDKLRANGHGEQDQKLSRVAVVVKPCDSRGVNVLLAEKQFERDQIHLIGVTCEGILEGAGFGKVDAGGYQSRCQRCDQRTPLLYDTLVGEALDVQISPDDPELDRLEAMSPAERMEFWLSQFDRCIRCYACRQACPMCTCPTCLYEQDESLWVGMGIRLNEKRTFHLGRAYHLAGRCIGCDECERVCPVDIPIGLLNRKLVKEVESAFGYQAGLAPVPSPITTILGGEEV